MKTHSIFFSTFLAILLWLSSGSKAAGDSLGVIKSQSLTIQTLSKKLQKDSLSHQDTLKKLKTQIPVVNECRSCEVNWMEKLLIILPAGLFLIFAFYFMKWLKREKFKLGDALASDKPEAYATSRVTTMSEAQPGVSATTETNEPVYSKSSSRLIAFLTSIAAIVIAISLITYYAYGYITHSGDMNNLDELWKIIAGLGIGIVPYVTKAIKSTPSQN